MLVRRYCPICKHTTRHVENGTDFACLAKRHGVPNVWLVQLYGHQFMVQAPSKARAIEIILPQLLALNVPFDIETQVKVRPARVGPKP